MDIRSRGVFLKELRCWIGMRDIFASEERDVSVGAVDVFFYRMDGAVSEMVSEDMFLGHVEA